MVECVFTIDYEIYGDGQGALADLVHQPAKQLSELFRKWGERFVTFVEVAELEKIEEQGSDRHIDLVKRQVNDLHKDGFEIALHLHPQWFNARYEREQWLLDISEYNLCTLARPRIAQIVERSLSYLRHLVREPSFTPLSFRAGNWLFQPTERAASVLAENGIRIDSSVFKGGLQRDAGLDYRRSLSNGDYWKFQNDVNQPHLAGALIEVPIYTEMVPSWRMATSKRMAFSRKSGASSRNPVRKLNRLMDRLRFRYPLKLDFCRMTLSELTLMMDGIIRRDREEPDVFRPVVAIGHTKDLCDLETVDKFLSYLKVNRIAVSTFTDVYPKLKRSLIQ